MTKTAQSAKNKVVVEIEADILKNIGDTILSALREIPPRANANEGRTRKKLLTLLRDHFPSQYKSHIEFVNQKVGEKTCC